MLIGQIAFCHEPFCPKKMKLNLKRFGTNLSKLIHGDLVIHLVEHFSHLRTVVTFNLHFVQKIANVIFVRGVLKTST